MRYLAAAGILVLIIGALVMNPDAAERIFDVGKRGGAATVVLLGFSFAIAIAVLLFRKIKDGWRPPIRLWLKAGFLTFLWISATAFISVLRVDEVPTDQEILFLLLAVAPPVAYFVMRWKSPKTTTGRYVVATSAIALAVTTLGLLFSERQFYLHQVLILIIGPVVVLTLWFNLLRWVKAAPSN